VRMSGLRVDSIPFGHLLGLNLEWLSWPLTILWIVIVTVAINFIDGLDGLAAGISAMAIGVIAVLAARNADSVMIVPTLALLGALTGFLFFNFNPAKIFMGDCGSMFIGFMLAVTAMKCNIKTQSLLGLALPAMALGIPLFDTAITMVRRGVLQRRSIFAAEKGHIHHKLIAGGMEHRSAVLTLYAATAVLAGLGVAMLYTDDRGRAVIMIVAVILTIIFFRKVGGVKLWETVVAVRRNAAISRDQKSYRNVFEQSQLRLATAFTFDDWWREACEAARHLQFRRLTLPITNRDGMERVMEWTSGPMPGPQQTITVTVPIRQRRAGGPLKAEAEVAVLDSLESAGARVTFFGRLMEEHCVAALPSADAVKSAQKKLASMPAAASPAPAARRSPRPQPASKAFRENRATPGSGGKRRIAIVHDFLYVYAGAEKVLEQMIEAFPDADLFALFDFLPHKDRGFLKGKTVHTSFIQRMPMAPTKHRHYLPLMPLAIEQLDVSRYDIVLSSSYCAAKGVITSPNQIHVCYCHSPIRFAWDMQAQYLHEAGLTYGLKSLFARAVLHYIRNWDVRSSNGVDQFVSNSQFVARRINKIYRRDAVVIYPPVDVENFTLETKKEDFYITTSRLVPYKRVDLIVEAFNRMPDKKLLVVGEGPDFFKIKGKAGPNVQMLGHQPFAQLKQYMQKAKAFVFAAEEDFGIVPVEAQACGTPVIAFGRGGVTESVVAGKTGIFFETQTIDALIAAVQQFEATPPMDPVAIREHAERFSNGRFRQELTGLVESEWEKFLSRLGTCMAPVSDRGIASVKPVASAGEPATPTITDNETMVRAS
jgi:glycosyltransferase involved in cell wall biosynthesis